MTGLKRFGVFVSGVASFGAALTIFLAATNSSVLVAEQWNAPVFNKIDVVATAHGLPIEDLHLQCTYFTGTALRKTRMEQQPCRAYAPDCLAPTCPFIGETAKTS